MKKRKLTWMLALIMALIATACSNDESIPGSGGNDNGVITFTVSPDYGVKTRAASAMPAGKVLRHILEVYDASNNVVTGSRQVIPVDDMDSPVEFSVEKKPGATYTVVFWADFTDNTNDEAKKKDLYYDTSGGLDNITFNTSNTTDFNGEAFFGNVAVDANGEAATTDITLTHAIAQVSLKTTTQLKNLNSVKVTYGSADDTTAPLSSFSAVTGKAGKGNRKVEKVNTVNKNETATESSPYNFHAFYAFAPTDTKGVVNMTVEMCTDDKGTTSVQTINVPNVPLQTNYKTNITGDFALAPTKLKITCEAGWADKELVPVSVWDGKCPTKPIDNYKYGGGTGTEDDPYLITNAAEFVYMTWHSQNPERFELRTDIDLNNVSWYNGAGRSNVPFLDGKGHTVSGLNADEPVEGYLGLFGIAKNNVIVKNLHVKGTINYTKEGDGIHCAGGIIAYDTEANGSLIGCSFEGDITLKNVSFVGGLAGQLKNATGCKYKGTITLTSSNGNNVYVGGIIGSSEDYVIATACYNEGNIKLIGMNECFYRMGGIVGHSGKSAKECYNIGTITAEGSLDTGGLIDDISSIDPGDVTNGGKPTYTTLLEGYGAPGDPSRKIEFETAWPIWKAGSSADGTEANGYWKSIGSSPSNYPKLWWEKD